MCNVSVSIGNLSSPPHHFLCFRVFFLRFCLVSIAVQHSWSFILTIAEVVLKTSSSTYWKMHESLVRLHFCKWKSGQYQNRTQHNKDFSPISSFLTMFRLKCTRNICVHRTDRDRHMPMLNVVVKTWTKMCQQLNLINLRVLHVCATVCKRIYSMNIQLKCNHILYLIIEEFIQKSFPTVCSWSF